MIQKAVTGAFLAVPLVAVENLESPTRHHLSDTAIPETRAWPLGCLPPLVSVAIGPDRELGPTSRRLPSQISDEERNPFYRPPQQGLALAQVLLPSVCPSDRVKLENINYGFDHRWIAGFRTSEVVPL